ncbi:MAG: TolC family protein [Thermoguttaceae bacterium]|nr:TolC family protein [Thermoguttaceae bacterium]
MSTGWAFRIRGVLAALAALGLFPSGQPVAGELLQPAHLAADPGPQNARTGVDAVAFRSVVPPLQQGLSEADPLTIAQLEHIAIQRNPTVAAAAHRVQALRGKYQQVGLYPNPIVGYIGEEIGDEGHAGQQGIAVGQHIVTAGKLKWNRSVVGWEIAAAEQEWAMQRLRVSNDLRAAAYRVIAAWQTVELSEKLLHLAEEGLRAAEQLLAAQEVSRVDVLQARIELNAARLSLEKAHHAHVQEWHTMATLAGVPDLPPAPVANGDIEPDSAPLAWETARDHLLRNSPEVMRAAAEVDRARAALGRECAGRVPDVELEAGVRYNFGSEGTLATVGMALPLQLFDRNQGNIHRANAELATARQESRRVELALEARLAREFREYLDARETVRRYREAILPDARDALDLARSGYQQGEFDYLELLTVQQTYFRTHLAFVEAERDVRVSRVRIDGLLLTGGLESPGL